MLRIVAARAPTAPLTLLAGALLAAPGSAQVPHAAHVARPPAPWVATFGGGAAEVVADAAAASTGGVFAGGVTHSFGQGQGDAWLARLDRRGVARWELALGGPDPDELRSLAATPDGGCIFAGQTRSFGAGGSDGWVVKLDADGGVQWQRTYGTAGDESFASIAPVGGASTADGYYVGGTAEFGATGRDAWLLRLDPSGGVLWQRTFAGEGDDELTALSASADGPVFVASSNSSLGLPAADVSFFRPWIVALDGQGRPRWQRSLDLSGGDVLVDIEALADGGFVLTGEILAMGFFRGDVWVVRLESSGALVWDARLGDNLGVNFVDSGRAVRALPDGGFLVAGSTGTAGAGSEDLWLLRLDAGGSLLADRTLGGVGYDGGNALVLTPDGDAVVGGFVQPAVPGPPDALLARVALGTLAPHITSCLPPSTGGPGAWTSALGVGAPAVPPGTAPAASAASGALATPLSSGSLVCP